MYVCVYAYDGNIFKFSFYSIAILCLLICIQIIKKTRKRRWHLHLQPTMSTLKHIFTNDLNTGRIIQDVYNVYCHIGYSYIHIYNILFLEKYNVISYNYKLQVNLFQTSTEVLIKTCFGIFFIWALNSLIHQYFKIMTFKQLLI